MRESWGEHEGYDSILVLGFCTVWFFIQCFFVHAVYPYSKKSPVHPRISDKKKHPEGCQVCPDLASKVYICVDKKN